MNDIKANGEDQEMISDADDDDEYVLLAIKADNHNQSVGWQSPLLLCLLIIMRILAMMVMVMAIYGCSER